LLFEKIDTAGLAHYSYIIGDQNEAVVIDPRRDIDVYLNKASKQGYQIKYIFETHRNEDYVIGSFDLAKLTGAQIWHADHNLNYQYGQAVRDQQKFSVGRLKIKAINTPGHTLNSFSYILYDFSKEPLMVFTGDALFAGDTGRVDLMGEDLMDELAHKLYDSIYNKILPLSDSVIMCPAHGSGSVCGHAIAERELTTLGLEKKVNPNLQYENEEEFVENVKEVLERPPYFREMEKLNLTGSSFIRGLPETEALKPGHFDKKLQSGDTLVLDIRNELDFAAAHIPNSISIWQEGLASFAGWFIPYDKDLLLMTAGNYPEEAINILRRLGYDRIKGYLKGGMLKWHMSGKKSSYIKTIRVQKLCTLIDQSRDYWLLDIRGEEEIAESGKIKNAHNIHITQLPDNLDKIPTEQPVYIFCGSGLRSTTAASLLLREGFENIHVILGGLAGWSSTTCPIV